jgi:hypothetical protein
MASVRPCLGPAPFPHLKELTITSLGVANMTKSKAARAIRCKPVSTLDPVRHQSGKGLVVSTLARFPAAIGDKVICAKSVIQAVRAAHDTQALDGENYDLSWPLGLAIDLLEQASHELTKAEDREARS